MRFIRNPSFWRISRAHYSCTVQVSWAGTLQSTSSTSLTVIAHFVNSSFSYFLVPSHGRTHIKSPPSGMYLLEPVVEVLKLLFVILETQVCGWFLFPCLQVDKSSPVSAPTMVRLEGITSSLSRTDVIAALECFGRIKSIILSRKKEQVSWVCALPPARWCHWEQQGCWHPIMLHCRSLVSLL